MTVFYDPQCFADASCRNGIFLAGVQDYVGAVYGKFGEVSFDGQLTDKEKAYIERNFGRITDLKQLPDYMERARRYLWDHMDEYRVAADSTSCKREKFLVTEAVSPDYGYALVLGGVHACGDLYGDLYLPYELAIAQAPEEWVFFIENADFDPANKQLREKLLFLRIAERLRIPVRNPVLQMENPLALDEMKKRHGIGKLDFAAYIAVLGIKIAQRELIKSEGGFALDTPEEMEALIERQIVRFSEQFKLTSQEVKAFRQMVSYLNQKELRDQALNFADTLVGWYGQIADELSPPLVEEGLASTGRCRALFQMGTGHLPVPGALYPLKPFRRPLAEN